MYSQEITRKNRTAFVIAIDQSGSMQDETTLYSRLMTKAQAVAILANALIDELVLRAKHCNTVRNYYDVAILGYSNDQVYSLLDYEGFVPITLLAEKTPPVREVEIISTGIDGKTIRIQEDYTEWIKARSEGNTPMYEMLTLVNEMIEQWCAEPQNHNSFPPIVFNITDGQASDCSPTTLKRAAQRLRSTSTNDGNTLLVNIHLSDNANEDTSRLLFPTQEEIPSDSEIAQLMADISSRFPAEFESVISRIRGAGANPPYIAMGYNTSVADAFSLLHIGSYSLSRIK